LAAQTDETIANIYVMLNLKNSKLRGIHISLDTLLFARALLVGIWAAVNRDMVAVRNDGLK